MRNSTPVGGGGKWASGAIWWLISTFSVSWLCRPHLLFWLPPHTFGSPWGHCLPGLWENFGNLPDTLLYFEKWLSVKSAVEWCVVILYVPPEGQGAVLWVVQGTWSYGPWWRAGKPSSPVTLGSWWRQFCLQQLLVQTSLWVSINFSLFRACHAEFGSIARVILAVLQRSPYQDEVA